MSSPPTPDVGPPPAEALAALDSDRWARLVPLVRAALHDLDDDDVTPVVERVRAAPVSRLAGGRVRRELCDLLAQGGPAWVALHERLEVLDPVPEGLGWLVGHGEAPADAQRLPARADRRTGGGADGGDGGRQQLARARQRLRDTRADRDAWRRRAEGAEARLEASTRELAAVRSQLEAAQAERDAVQEQLAAAGEERTRAVGRERRRRDAEIAALRDELSALRRAEQQRQTEKRRRIEAREQVERAAAREIDQARRSGTDGRLPQAVPGRPSQLPHGVAPGTTQAAKALLHTGRLVLVDGYNVTKTHRGNLDLEAQRKWLVGLVATLAARRHIHPTIVFDGEHAGGTRSPSGARDVIVRFTDVGVTADDELVLGVEGTDEPVVVVTDDRELTARVTASGADVVGTRAFLGAAS